MDEYSVTALVWAVGLFRTTDRRAVNSRLAKMAAGWSYTMTFDFSGSGLTVTVPRAVVRWISRHDGLRAVNAFTGYTYKAWFRKPQIIEPTELKAC